jgi:hypothetical protein
VICLPQAAGALPGVRKVPQGAVLWQALSGAGLASSQGQLQFLMLVCSTAVGDAVHDTCHVVLRALRYGLMREVAL